MTLGPFIQVSEIGQATMAFYATIKMSPRNVLIGRDIQENSVMLILSWLLGLYTHNTLNKVASTRSTCKTQYIFL